MITLCNRILIEIEHIQIIFYSKKPSIFLVSKILFTKYNIIQDLLLTQPAMVNHDHNLEKEKKKTRRPRYKQHEGTYEHQILLS